MIFQSYAIWPNMTVGENVGFGLRGAQAAAGRDRAPRRPHPRRRADARAQGSLSGRAVGRPAAARGAGARHRGRARGPAARRAAVQPRRQPARGDALRDPPPARRVQDHHGLRHARPVRGDGDLRPHRGDEQGPHRADRPAARPVRPAARAASSRASSAAPTSSSATAATYSTPAASDRPVGRQAGGQRRRGRDRRPRLSRRVLGLPGASRWARRSRCASRPGPTRSSKSASGSGWRSIPPPWYEWSDQQTEESER